MGKIPRPLTRFAVNANDQSRWFGLISNKLNAGYRSLWMACPQYWFQKKGGSQPARTKSLHSYSRNPENSGVVINDVPFMSTDDARCRHTSHVRIDHPYSSGLDLKQPVCRSINHIAASILPPLA